MDAISRARQLEQEASTRQAATAKQLAEKKKEAMNELKQHSPDTLEFIKQASKEFGKFKETTIYVNGKLFIFEGKS